MRFSHCVPQQQLNPTSTVPFSVSLPLSSFILIHFRTPCFCLTDQLSLLIHLIFSKLFSLSYKAVPFVCLYKLHFAFSYLFLLLFCRCQARLINTRPIDEIEAVFLWLRVSTFCWWFLLLVKFAKWDCALFSPMYWRCIGFPYSQISFVVVIYWALITIFILNSIRWILIHKIEF